MIRFFKDFVIDHYTHKIDFVMLGVLIVCALVIMFLAFYAVLKLLSALAYKFEKEQTTQAKITNKYYMPHHYIYGLSFSISPGFVISYKSEVFTLELEFLDDEKERIRETVERASFDRHKVDEVVTITYKQVKDCDKKIIAIE